MKKMLTLLASVAALALVLSACTTIYTGEEYYGYSPKHKQNNDTVPDRHQDVKWAGSNGSLRKYEQLISCQANIQTADL